MGCLVVFFLTVLAVFYLPAMGLQILLEIPFRVFAGWFLFARDRAAQVSPVWSDVALAGVLLGVITIGGHLFAVWLKRSRDGEGKRWRASWTVRGIGLLTLGLLASTAMLGAVHQAFWMATSQGALTENNFSAFFAGSSSRQLGNAVKETLKQSGELPTRGHLAEHLPGHSWMTALLPHLPSQSGLYEKLDRNSAWDSTANRPVMSTEIPAFQQRSMMPTKNSKGYAVAHYAGNLRLLGRTEPDSGRRIPDGHSSTILAGQVRFRFRPWGDARNLRDPAAGLNTRADGFWSPGAHAFFVMADGRVQTMNSDIDPRVLNALSTPDGGDTVPNHFSR